MIDFATIAAVTAALTALVGSVVAGYAYRGYRRNGSERMRALAAGIVAIAVVPPVVTYPVNAALALSDAAALLLVLSAHTLGLLAVYRSLE